MTEEVQVFDNLKARQKTIELSPDGKSSIEIIDSRRMIIKSPKIIINGQVKFLRQWILD